MISSAKQIILPPLPTIKDLLRLYNLRALKQLSQNFLLDQRISDKIVKAAGKITHGHVCEVGPGPGIITRSILRRSPSSLILVEKDKRFLPMLEMLKDSSPAPIDVIYEDVLSLNMEKLFPKELARSWLDSPPNIHIIGNLPFNVATPLIIRWLKHISERTSAWAYGRVKLTLTFQKEVAERIVSPILTTQRCRLSVMAQNWCSIRHAFNIPGAAFTPKPEVDVGVVHFVPLLTPVIDQPFGLVEKVTRCLFSFRQKYVVKSLGNLFPKHSRQEMACILLAKADIPKESRAYQIELPEIGRICQAYQDMIHDNPSLGSYNYRISNEILFDDSIGDSESALI